MTEYADVMTRGVSVPTRLPMDRSSVRYPNVEYSGICRASKSLMLEFLKTCFENLPDGHQFKYDEVQERSKINIIDKLTFNFDEVDKRPSLVVHRGTLGYNKVARDQRVVEDRLIRKEEGKDGGLLKTGLINGILMIQCYGKGQTLQAELLGDAVFELITDMEEALRDIGFFECYATGIGEEVPVLQGSKVRYIMVPVAVKFSMQRSWTITPENLRRLRNVTMAKLTINDKII